MIRKSQQENQKVVIKDPAKNEHREKKETKSNNKVRLQRKLYHSLHEHIDIA